VEVEVVMIELVDRGQKLVDRVVEVDRDSHIINGRGLQEFKILRMDTVMVMMGVTE
jgi:hypothetical protein